MENIHGKKMFVRKMIKKKLYIISIFVLFIDVISKLLVINNLSYNKKISIINNFFNFNFVKNKGVAFSFLSGNLLLIIMITFIILYFIYKYLKDKELRLLELWGYAFIIGGALGNLFDRIIYGYVIDFIDIYIFGYDFPVFNIADCGVVVGVFLIILDSFFNKGGSKDENKSKRKNANR